MARTMRGAVRWYERGRWPYAADRHTADAYADWVKMVPWRLFCTFTFAWKVSDQQADKTFAAFIDRLERSLKADVIYVRGDEKRLSGCGKPACGRHFHVLMTSAAQLDSSYVEWLWMEMAGARKDEAGAKVDVYDPSRGGASYVLKLINHVDGDWTFRNLLLAHPYTSLADLNCRKRRNLRRHLARNRAFAQSDQSNSVVSPLDGYTERLREYFASLSKGQSAA